MVVTRPEDLAQRWAEAFNAGDAEALVALYEPRATLVTPGSGQALAGQDAIREMLEQLLALKATMAMQTEYCVAGDDLALGRVRWRLTGTASDGQPLDMRGCSIEVYRRQNDGSWRYAIDHASGGD